MLAKNVGSHKNSCCSEPNQNKQGMEGGWWAGVTKRKKSNPFNNQVNSISLK
jgi:hypothetical protein